MVFCNSFKNNRLLINMTVNDLKSLIGLSHSKPKEGMAHEYRENDIFSNHSAFASSRIPKCVSRYNGDYKIRNFSCLDQFLVMAFAQLTCRESLRDIEVCLRAMSTETLPHGHSRGIARNTLARANETRDWRMYSDFAHALIRTARRLYANDDFGVDLEQTVYAFDSTTIDLCLALFPWARFRRHKGAVKLHTLLDLRGNIPSLSKLPRGKSTMSTPSTI